MQPLPKEFEVGQMFRSETNKVLLTIKEIDQKEDAVTLQVADSDYHSEGPLSNLKELLETSSCKLITKEQFDEFMKTYTDDIAAVNRDYEKKQMDQLRKMCVEFKDIKLTDVPKEIEDKSFGQMAPVIPLTIDFDTENPIGWAIVARKDGTNEIYGNLYVIPKAYEHAKRLYPATSLSIVPADGVELEDEEQMPEDLDAIGGFCIEQVTMVMQHKDLDVMPYLKQLKDYPASAEGVQL